MKNIVTNIIAFAAMFAGFYGLLWTMGHIFTAIGVG